MFCRNCGKELKEDSSFCSNCGFPIDKNSIDMIQAESSNIGKESSDKDSSNNSEAEPVDESKKKWSSTEDIVKTIGVEIPSLVLTIILVKFRVLPGISASNNIEFILSLIFSSGILLYFFLSLSVFDAPFSAIALIYYSIKSNPEKAKHYAIEMAISLLLGVVSFVLLTIDKYMQMMLNIILLIIVGIIGLLGDKDKKENKEK